MSDTGTTKNILYLHNVGCHVLHGFTLRVKVIVRLYSINQVMDGRRDFPTQSISGLLQEEGRDARN